MARYLKDIDCALYGTADCDMLNMPDCPSCPVHQTNDAAAVQQELHLLRGLLPSQGVAPLADSRECLFCQGEEKGKASGWALLDMYHPQPQRDRPSPLYRKAKVKQGSWLPVQIACCDRCKKRIWWLQNMPAFLWLIALAFGLILLTTSVVSDALERAATWLPLVLMVLLLALCGLGVFLLKRSANRKSRGTVSLNALEIPQLQPMLERGWKALYPGRQNPRLVFLKSPVTQGVGTGNVIDQDK